ncbi:2-isopropylmalate synthase [Colletotrichum asianum]|uniref:2-isopropylmalate synthase n=1 Tax=Colletotrichum asianum TaxID=702518 RepID=A0A8H3VYT7_9PEZI|nr:2-isopropylmalate synthase [Colletotrichum asianum]
MICEALAREISHQEVINLFIASYARTAQAMAVVAAAVHLHRRKLSALPLKKHGATTRMDAKAAPPQTITKA